MHAVGGLHNTKYCPFCLFFRLALYVYEYLLHVGAQKSAQTFLSELYRGQK
uniref:LisH domain-containing protein n=1 Tax=Accipiter nisus TaxID=211598 RepID=A0A8B9NJ05_9AVES